VIVCGLRREASRHTSISCDCLCDRSRFGGRKAKRLYETCKRVYVFHLFSFVQDIFVGLHRARPRSTRLQSLHLLVHPASIYKAFHLLVFLFPFFASHFQSRSPRSCYKTDLGWVRKSWGETITTTTLIQTITVSGREG
jgi:hypothetical protein